jgi:transposase
METQVHTRKPYPTDVRDEAWQVVASYMALVREDSPQRRHDLREVFNALRWIVHMGAPWRYLPGDFPPPGRRDSAAWPKITNACPTWSSACISSPLPT